MKYKACSYSKPIFRKDSGFSGREKRWIFSFATTKTNNSKTK
jgi:hypothetical protein